MKVRGVRVSVDGFIGGSAVGTRFGEKPPRTYPEGRTCHCGVVLSRYNKDAACALHSGKNWAAH